MFAFKGSIIGGHRLIRPLGAGGMGEVWLAEHLMLGRPAAIKVLHASFSARPEIVARFFNEARAATAISDPGIVQVFDFGQHTDGNVYIVMELLEGEPLDVRIRRRGLLTVGESLRLLRQVASSLALAHARGIVHRDLKPENIFIVRHPEVAGGERTEILDFGIAKLASDQTGVKTQTSALMGTPVFMSPEQCRGAGLVDLRSDIYSLGCVLFDALTGRPPFDAEGAGEIIAMHLREPPPVPSASNPTIPRAVDELVAQCLDKDPARRFATAAALATAVGAILERIPATAPGTAHVPALPPITAPIPAVSVAAGSAPTTLSSASSEVVASSPSPPRRAGRLVAAGFGAFAFAAIAVFAVVRGAGGGEPIAPGAQSEPTSTGVGHATPGPSTGASAATSTTSTSATSTPVTATKAPPTSAASAPAPRVDGSTTPASAPPTENSHAGGASTTATTGGSPRRDPTATSATTPATAASAPATPVASVSLSHGTPPSPARDASSSPAGRAGNGASRSISIAAKPAKPTTPPPLAEPAPDAPSMILDDRNLPTKR